MLNEYEKAFMRNLLEQSALHSGIPAIEFYFELYKMKTDYIINNLDEFPDLVAYIRLKELNKLL